MASGPYLSNMSLRRAPNPGRGVGAGTGAVSWRGIVGFSSLSKRATLAPSAWVAMPDHSPRSMLMSWSVGSAVGERNHRQRGRQRGLRLAAVLRSERGDGDLGVAGAAKRAAGHDK